MAPRLITGITHTPKVLALDEFHIGAQKGYLTALYAPLERRIVQLSLGHSQTSAEALLDQLPEGEQVQAVVMDMTEGFRQAVQLCCPRAAIVVDKFHVLTHVLNALQRVCFQVQSQAAREDIAVLRKRSLFTAKSTDLTLAEQQQRDRMLAKYPQLATAWECVQSFRRIYRADSRATAAEALEEWWDRIQREGPRAFLGLRHMLSHWREEILNYFDHPVTNGFAEGKNNRIKVIIRTGYGYRNVTNLTRRIQLTNRSEADAWGALSPHFLT